MRPSGWGGDLGPVQVVLIGIDPPGADQMLAAELQDLGTQDAIRVLDVLRVQRGNDDEVRRLDPLDPDGHPGTLVEALLVVDPNGREPAGERRTAEAGGGEGEWFLADRVPRGATAAILLIEHRWAIPLREAASKYEAEVFGDAWVHPRDLDAARRAVEAGAG
ncbi:MAG: hypothetical protein JST08_19905 [Actinobacteria bacterium]|nr:hypothetical protein [Actinomycetota bacterium]